MKHLFLTSSVGFVAHDIAKRINTKGIKLAFILTATEVEEGDLEWLRRDRQSLIDAGFELTDYTFTGKTKEEVEDFLKDFDVIYVSGGNTFWLLGKIQESDSAKVIIDFVESGKIYIGTSAGSIIAGPDIYPTRNLVKFENAPKLEDYSGLGLVDFMIYPHWGAKDFETKQAGERMKNSWSEKYPIILLPDNSYMEVKEESYRIIKV